MTQDNTEDYFVIVQDNLETSVVEESQFSPQPLTPSNPELQDAPELHSHHDTKIQTPSPEVPTSETLEVADSTVISTPLGPDDKHIPGSSGIPRLCGILFGLDSTKSQNVTSHHGKNKRSRGCCL